MLVRCLPVKKRKRLARDVIHTSATYADLVQDVTDTDCQTQNGFQPSHVDACSFVAVRATFLTKTSVEGRGHCVGRMEGCKT